MAIFKKQFPALPAATVPLSGPEIMALVQGGISKRATIQDIVNRAQLPLAAMIAGIAANTASIITIDGQIVTLTSGLGTANANIAALAAALAAGTFLTSTDVDALFPAARQLLPGTNVTFDDTVPGARTLNASGGGGGGGIATILNPTALPAGNTSDWDPPNLQDVDTVVMTSVDSCAIDGIAAPVPLANKRLWLVNGNDFLTSNFDITITTMIASTSLSANRIYAGSSSPALSPGKGCLIVYDTGFGHWRYLDRV